VQEAPSLSLAVLGEQQKRKWVREICLRSRARRSAKLDYSESEPNHINTKSFVRCTISAALSLQCLLHTVFGTRHHPGTRQTGDPVSRVAFFEQRRSTLWIF